MALAGCLLGAVRDRFAGFRLRPCPRGAGCGGGCAIKEAAQVFTGLVETMGEIAALQALRDGDGVRLVVRCPSIAHGAAVGDSVAVNGCCLTVTAVDGDTLAFDAVPETLARTNLRHLT